MIRFELAKTGDRRWWSEGGASSWGFGIEISHYGSEHWDEATDTSTLESEGHSVAVMFGPWSLIVSSQAAFKATHGPNDLHLYPRFEVVRP